MINKPITTITLTGPQLVAFFELAVDAGRADTMNFEASFIDTLDEAMNVGFDSGRMCKREWVESLAQRLLEDARS